jgi:hypothetical protein
MASRQDHRAKFHSSLDKLAAAGGSAKPAGTQAKPKPQGTVTVARLPSGVVIHAKEEHCNGAGVHSVRTK